MKRNMESEEGIVDRTRKRHEGDNFSINEEKNNS